LAQSKISVLQIALGVGFGSAEAFTHAFAARFGRSPTTWRLRQAAERAAISNPDQTNGKPDQAKGRQTRNNAVPKMQAETPMKVEIVEREPTPIAYLRHVGPYGEPIGVFWQAQVYPWMVTNGLIGQPRYGISHDDPAVTAQEQCRYDAGCANYRTTRWSAEMRIELPSREVNTRRSASRGVVADFEPAWDRLLRDWLPSSGLQLDNRPMFEYYPTDSTYDPATGVLECKLCVPVMPL
jgi:AraC family transcriptional regulator